jgi:hypothetical protein
VLLSQHVFMRHVCQSRLWEGVLRPIHCWGEQCSPRVVPKFVTSLLRLGTRKFVSLMENSESSSFRHKTEKARYLD